MWDRGTLEHVCRQFRIPSWIVSILEQAATMKNDKCRRQKAYRLIRKKLWDAGIGLEKAAFPTYVYPQELKNLIRFIFPAEICNYPDPSHTKVVTVTLEDILSLESQKRLKEEAVD